MNEFERNNIEKSEEEALVLEKADIFVLWQYELDRKSENFDPDVAMVGFVATVESKDVTVEGILSRKDNVLVAYTSYSEFLNILKNPKVLRIEMCWDIELLLSNTSDEIVITVPSPGPVDDEWDSPSYDSFWSPVENELQRKIKRLESVGKKVIIL
ncbi:MAG TPA: hypothetical protein PLI45_00805 [Candidatus Woesebacteria bacterium]|mgnify:CR=1 FL=1|nr:hypothetical protein [Candidatus Woesebacteria bacterium]